MKRIIKLVVSLLYHTAGAPLRLVEKAFPSRRRVRGVVLYYHGVSAEQLPRFRRQMEYLKRRAKVVRLGELFSGSLRRGAVCITFDDALGSVRTRVLPVLRDLGLPATVFAVSGNLGRTPEWAMTTGHPDADEVTLSTEELGELGPLMDVGSHTVTHPNLRMIPAGQVRSELFESKRALQGGLKRRIDLLSVPYGAYDQQTIRIAREAGYARLLTSEPELWDPASDRLEVGRFQVSPDDWGIEFRLKCAGAYAWLGRIRETIRARRPACAARSHIRTAGHASINGPRRAGNTAGAGTAK